jgi:hypothetical protein
VIETINATHSKRIKDWIISVQFFMKAKFLQKRLSHAVAVEKKRRLLISNARFIAIMMNKFLRKRSLTLEQRVAREARDLVVLKSVLEKRTCLDRIAKSNICSFLRAVYPKRALELRSNRFIKGVVKV